MWRRRPCALPGGWRRSFPSIAGKSYVRGLAERRFLHRPFARGGLAHRRRAEPHPDRSQALDGRRAAEPPLVVHDGQGYSAEVRRMLGEET